MIKRFKSLEENFTVSRAAFIIGFFTVFAKVIAAIRDPIFSSKFGGKDLYILDIYNSAFRLPDFITALLIAGTLSAAFIPVYVEVLLRDKKQAKEFSSTITNIIFLCIFFICLVGFILSRPLTHLMVPGFTGQNFDQTVQLTKLFLLSPVIFSVSYILGSILNANKKFIITGLAPILYNVGIIFGATVLYDRFGILGLGWGVILGALLHMLIQLPLAVKYGFSWQPVLNVKMPAVVKMIKLYIPRIFAIDLLTVSLIISTIVGSHLAAGSIAIFVFASNLQAVASGIFGISFATAAFPVFSELFAKKDDAAFVKSLYRVLFQILFFIVPITILFLLYRAYGVRLYLGHGKFTWDNTIETFKTLGYLSFSIVSLSISPVLTRAFFSRHNTITPVLLNVASIAVNALAALYLAPRMGVSGLAVAFTAASLLNALLLFVFLHHTFAKVGGEAAKTLADEDKKLMAQLLKILVASVALGIVGRYSLRLAEPLVDNTTFAGLLIQTGVSAGLAVLAYFYACKLLKLDMAEYMAGKIKKLVGF